MISIILSCIVINTADEEARKTGLDTEIGRPCKTCLRIFSFIFFNQFLYTSRWNFCFFFFGEGKEEKLTKIIHVITSPNPLPLPPWRNCAIYILSRKATEEKKIPFIRKSLPDTRVSFRQCVLTKWTREREKRRVDYVHLFICAGTHRRGGERAVERTRGKKNLWDSSALFSFSNRIETIFKREALDRKEN